MLEEAKQNSGWTLDTLHEHLVQLIQANDKRCGERHDGLRDLMKSEFVSQKEQVAFALAAAEQAVSKAETAAEKRFDSVNEFRNTLSDQQRTLMPRSEVEVLLHSIDDKFRKFDSEIQKIDNGLAEVRAKGKGANELWLVFFGVAVLLISLFSHFWK